MDPIGERLAAHPRAHWQPERPRRHYLVAPAGAPNWGDELIITSWVRLLVERCPDDTVIVDCHHPGKVSALLGSLHPHLVVTDTLWHLVSHATEVINKPADAYTDEDIAHLAELTAQWVLNPGPVADYATNMDLLGSVDTVHLVGGGYLNALWPHHLGIVNAVNAVVQRPRGEGEPAPLFVATGQGLIPAYEPLCDALLEVDMVTVRDEPSRTALRARHAAAGASGRPAPIIEIGGDDAWLAVALNLYDARRAGAWDETPGAAQSSHLRGRVKAKLAASVRRQPQASSPAAEKPSFLGDIPASTDDTTSLLTPDCTRFPYQQLEGPHTVLCIQNDLIEDPTRVQEWVLQVLRSWEVTGSELVVVEAFPYQDVGVWLDVIQPHYPEARFIPFADLWRQGLPVGEQVRWLSTRFHPHLLAAAAGCPGVAIDAHAQDYYTVKHLSVQNSGSLWPVATVPGAAEVAELAEVVVPEAPNVDALAMDPDQFLCRVRGALRIAEALY